MQPLPIAASLAPQPVADVNLPLWERTMRAAVASSRAGQLQVAVHGYQAALDIARELIDQPPAARIDDCIAALVVSFLNLADAQAGTDAPDRAVKLLSDAHESLITLFLDPERPADLRQAALRHTRETHMALLTHVSTHGKHPLSTRVLELASLALGPDSARPH